MDVKYYPAHTGTKVIELCFNIPNGVRRKRKVRKVTTVRRAMFLCSPTGMHIVSASSVRQSVPKFCLDFISYQLLTVIETR